ncbi:multicopper oxidase family protein [Streptomyces sp. NPDC015127]|uniref:multicopper oxidase family protein n=1 Tax=Streptomyces sp. NPDC015127 TaxID=3364939 RepID=UPI0036F58ED3
MISRRTALRAGIGAAGAVGGAALIAPAFSGGVALAADLDPSAIAKYAVPMPVPRVLQPTSVSGTTSTYTVTMKEITKEILPGRRTRLRTYNGEFPGPVIKARSGQRVVIKQINNLAQPTSVHLHGAHVPQDSDGGPMDLIPPGGSKTYTYPNQQPHANLWFHDHAHHEEAEHVYRGLSGFYLLTDDIESRLDLPEGLDDIPIALREARFDESGELVYVMDDFMNRNTILTNGVPWPYFSVEARKYRFRVFNQSNLRFFDLRLGAGETFWQIGGDGGLLEKPLQTTAVKLSPGERVDIVVDFAKYVPGTRLELTNTEGPGPAEHVGKVMQFRVMKNLTVGAGPLPSVLRTMPALPPATVQRTFDLSMDEDGRPNAQGYINGKVYDMHRIDTEVKLGVPEIWTVTNSNKLAPHNFHVHLAMFRVLERNGRPVANDGESAWKDTVSLKAGESVKLQVTFESYRGDYVYHCHLIDHAAMGMMGNLRVV